MTTKTLDVYKLKGLPFELGRYDVARIGRDIEWSRLNELVAMVRGSRSPVTGVLLGTYGAGKSFMLWQLARHLDPAKRSGVLASGPIRLIDPEQKKDFTKSLILRFFARGIDIDRQLVPVLNDVPKTGLEPPTEIRPYVELLLALTRKKSVSIARRVLAGGRALRKEAQDAGFPDVSHVRTVDDAVALLQALQFLLKAAGVTALALFIDEAEYIDQLPKGQRIAVLDSLKHLWDQEVDFFSKGAEAAQLLILLAATPAFWNQARAQLLTEGGRGSTVVGVTPFFARIRKADVIEMPAELEPDEARKLIVNRMSEARAGQRREDIIPFSDDYVDYVYQLSQGLPRQIIEICGVVLTEAAQRKLKTIDKAAAKKILRDLMISYEPPTAAKD